MRRQTGSRRNCNSLLWFCFPAVVRIGDLLAATIALQNESGAIAHLGYRGVHAEVPDRGGQKICSRAQIWPQVVRFESPMRQVGSSRAAPDALLIDVKKKLIIRTDAHNKMRGRAFEFEKLSKVEDGRIAHRRIGASNPVRSPLWEVWSGLRGSYSRAHSQPS